MILTGRVCISIILLVASSWFISSCSGPAAAPPAAPPAKATEQLDSPAATSESPTVPPAGEVTSSPGETATSDITVVSADPGDVTPIELTERQEEQLRNMVWGWLYNSRSMPSHPTQLQDLAGLVLATDRAFPGYIDGKLRTHAEGEEFTRKIQPLLAFIDNLNDGQRDDLANTAIQAYHLNDGSVLINAAPGTFAPGAPQVEYDLERGATTFNLNIMESPLHDYDSLRFAEGIGDPKAHVRVTATVLNPVTLTEELVSLPVLEVAIEEADSEFFTNRLRIVLDGYAGAWSKVEIEPGVLTDNGPDPLFLAFTHIQGLNGADLVMSLRPMNVSNPNLFHPSLYGGSFQPLPRNLTGADLENAMAQDLQTALALAVQDGSITPERASELQGRFDDADLMAVVMNPVLRAAVLLAASVPETGGDFILDMLLGQNITDNPIRMFFDNDPELSQILTSEGRGLAPYNIGTFYMRTNGDMIFVLANRFDNGTEPIEAIAALMPHEIIGHTSSREVNIFEEVFSNILESVTWVRLLERNPGLLDQPTEMIVGRNSNLLAMLNSVYKDNTGSYVGILSEHMQDWNVYPGSSLSHRSYFDLMKNFHYADNNLAETAAGGPAIERVLLTLLDDGPNVDEKFLTESFTENLIRHVDSHLHRVITNERAVNLARLMGLEAGSGSR